MRMHNRTRVDGRRPRPRAPRSWRPRRWWAHGAGDASASRSRGRRRRPHHQRHERRRPDHRRLLRARLGRRGPRATVRNPTLRSRQLPLGEVDLRAGDDDFRTISGGSLADVPMTVATGNGNDVATTGAGSDVLDGGNGEDLLLGGAGTDVVGWQRRRLRQRRGRHRRRGARQRRRHRSLEPRRGQRRHRRRPGPRHLGLQRLQRRRADVLVGQRRGRGLPPQPREHPDGPRRRRTAGPRDARRRGHRHDQRPQRHRVSTADIDLAATTGPGTRGTTSSRSTARASPTRSTSQATATPWRSPASPRRPVVTGGDTTDVLRINTLGGNDRSQSATKHEPCWTSRSDLGADQSDQRKATPRTTGDHHVRVPRIHPRRRHRERPGPQHRLVRRPVREFARPRRGRGGGRLPPHRVRTRRRQPVRPAQARNPGEAPFDERSPASTTSRSAASTVPSSRSGAAAWTSSASSTARSSTPTTGRDCRSATRTASRWSSSLRRRPDRVRPRHGGGAAANTNRPAPCSFWREAGRFVVLWLVSRSMPHERGRQPSANAVEWRSRTGAGGGCTPARVRWV